MNTKVEYSESVSIKVGHFFKAKGFFLANNNGIVEPSLTDRSYIGLLCRNPAQKKRLFGLIKPGWIFLGVIWFHNTNLGASEKQWIFELRGIQYQAFVQNIVNELTTQIDVEKISIRLVQEEPDFHAIFSDVSCS